MSRYQQIRVRVEPMYDQGLAKAFPRLQALLAKEDAGLAEKSPALYDLVPSLVELSQDQGLPAAVGKAIESKGPAIVRLRAAVEEAIGGWKLSQAEKLLNDLEDAFAALEEALP